MLNYFALHPATKSIIDISSIFRCAVLVLCIGLSIYIGKKLKCLSAIQHNVFILTSGVLLFGLDIITQTFSLIGIGGLICVVSYFLKPSYISNILYFFLSTFCLSYSVTSYILMAFTYFDVTKVVELFLCIYVGIYLIITNSLIYKDYCIIICGFIYSIICLCIELINISSTCYINIIFDLFVYLFSFVINKSIERYYRYLER